MNLGGNITVVQLAKDVVLYGNDQAKVQKLYDAYLENKTDEIKDAFISKYMHEKYVCTF